jgi:hypothetical protein
MSTVNSTDRWQPDWVALRILDFARKIHEFGSDDKALASWARQMSEDLIFNNSESEDQFTQDLLAEAADAYSKRSERGRKGGLAKARKNKSKEAAGSGNARNGSTTGLEESAPTAEEYDQEAPQPAEDNRGQAIMQDAAIGNDAEDLSTADNCSYPESPTPCNYSNGAVSPREREKNIISTDNSVAAGTTTDSVPFALDKPAQDQDKRTAKTRDSHGSGRYQPPSLGPEDGTIDTPATDGDIREESLNLHDGSNAARMESGTSAAGDSFDEARQCQRPREGRKTRTAGISQPAVRPPPSRDRCAKIPIPPRNSEDVRLFALDNNLDVDDARMWYQMNFIDRPGCDKDGVVIINWKGHCTAYCKAEAERRKAG